MTEQIETAQAETVVSLGLRLKHAREAAGLTVDAVADQLKLKNAIITAIERDQFDEQVSPTFTRGYLRSYARLVNADVEAILKQFDALEVAQKQYFKMQSFSQRTNTEAQNNLLAWISALIAVVLMSLFVIWWYQNMVSGGSAADTTSDSVVASVVEVVAETPPDGEAQTSPDSRVDKPLLTAPGESLLASDDAVTEAPQPPVSTAAVGEDERVEGETTVESAAEVATISAGTASADAESMAALTDKVLLEFTFNGDCWVKVIDATNEVLAIGIKRAGKHMPLMGVAPFEVILGAPQVVNIQYQGEPLDTSGFRQGHTARFKVPLEGQEG